MNKDVPKWVQISIVLVIAVVALLVFTSQDRIHVYGTYLREKSPEITTNLLALSIGMDEAMLRKHFEGVPLTCVGQGPGADTLGDRVCHTSIDKADGDAALTLAAFFRKGRLAHLIVQMPWWVHKSWVSRFTAQFGQPSYAGVTGGLGGPVLRWTMPNGYVESSRDRSFNPLNWNVIIWTSAQSAK
jgi:hypothetical protein